MIRPEQSAPILALAKRLHAEGVKFERRAASRDRCHTPKQHQKLEADLNWAAMEMIKIEVQFHVACVDAGIADLRPPAHYAERDFHPSGWHHYKWTPPLPEIMKERAR